MKAGDAEFISELIVEMAKGDSASIIETAAESFANGTGGTFFEVLADLSFKHSVAAATANEMTWQELTNSTVVEVYTKTDRLELADALIKALTIQTAWLANVFDRNPEVRAYYRELLAQEIER